MTSSTTNSSARLKEALQGLEWEAERGTLDTGRYRMAFARWGQGPPLIFLHGLAESLEASALVMADLSRDYQCVAYQQPTGEGDGAHLPTYRHEDLADDLFALMNHLQIARATVVGHSFGTTIALRAMHQRPFRVQRAVLACGFAHRPLSFAEWALAQVGRILAGRLCHSPFWKPMLHFEHRRPFLRQPADVWRFHLEQSGRSPVRAVAHWSRALHEVDLRPILPQLRQPTLIVTGDHDPLVPLKLQEQLFRQMPHAAMFQIDGCGHFPLLTHPDALADAIRRFVPHMDCPLASAGAIG